MTWPHDAALHAWWVEPGQILAGEYPGSTDPGVARRKIGLLLDAGITSIVDLTHPADKLTPYTPHLQRTRYMSYPIPDMGVIDYAGYDQITAYIRRQTDSGGTVYVHCWGGRGRTSTVVGALLAAQGLDYWQVLARIAELREGTRKASIGCPESRVQHDVLRAKCAAAMAQGRQN